MTGKLEEKMSERGKKGDLVVDPKCNPKNEKPLELEDLGTLVFSPLAKMTTVWILCAGVTVLK